MVEELETLVQDAKEGKQEAFDRLHERYKGLVYSLVLTFPCDGLSEDHVQEIFVRAFTRIKQVRNNLAFGGWVYRIGVNYMINAFRGKRGGMNIPRYRQKLLQVIDLVDMECSTGSTLKIAVELLPPRQKQVMDVFYFGNHDKRLVDITEEHSIPSSTVYKSLDGIYKNLQTIIPLVEKYGEGILAYRGFRTRGSFRSRKNT